MAAPRGGSHIDRNVRRPLVGVARAVSAAIGEADDLTGAFGDEDGWVGKMDRSRSAITSAVGGTLSNEMAVSVTIGA